jgi:hypothetical protein
MAIYDSRDLAPNHKGAANGFSEPQAITTRMDFVGLGHVRETAPLFQMQDMSILSTDSTSGQMFGFTNRELQVASRALQAVIFDSERMIVEADSPDTYTISTPGGFPLVGEEPYVAARVTAIWDSDGEPHHRLNSGFLARAGWLSFVVDGNAEEPHWLSQPTQVCAVRGKPTNAMWVYCYPGATLVVNGYKRRPPQVGYDIVDGVTELWDWAAYAL